MNFLGKAFETLNNVSETFKNAFILLLKTFAKLYFIITENPKWIHEIFFMLLQLSLCQRGTLQLCENSGIWYLFSW